MLASRSFLKYHPALPRTANYLVFHIAFDIKGFEAWREFEVVVLDYSRNDESDLCLGQSFANALAMTWARRMLAFLRKKREHSYQSQMEQTLPSDVPSQAVWSNALG